MYALTLSRTHDGAIAQAKAQLVEAARFGKAGAELHYNSNACAEAVVEALRGEGLTVIPNGSLGITRSLFVSGWANAEN